MPKRLLPVLERALRKFETDTGVRPRTVYVTPVQKDRLCKEIRINPGHDDALQILDVKVVTDHHPKAARIRALLPERDVARIETLSTPMRTGLEASVSAFGRNVRLHIPARVNFGRLFQLPEPTMSREQMIEEAAKHFAKIVSDEDLTREELRIRPVPPLWRYTARNRLRPYEAWYDEAATVDMTAYMNSTMISAANIGPASISPGRIWNTTTQGTTSTRAVGQATAAEMLEQMRAAARVLDAAQVLPTMERLRNDFIQSAMVRDPALTGLTESATARQATSAGTQESPQPTLRSPSRAR